MKELGKADASGCPLQHTLEQQQVGSNLDVYIRDWLDRRPPPLSG